MKLHEKQLKKVIKFIEKYASVRNIKVINSSTSISLPTKNKVMEIDLSRPQTYQIEFIMGSEKETLPHKKNGDLK